MKLSDIMVCDAVVPELKAESRDDAIVELVNALAAAGAIPKNSTSRISKAVLARETKATTGIGKGVALPHAKCKGVRKPIGTIGVSQKGIDFSALDSKPVHSVILLVSSPDGADEHLEAMETIFNHIQKSIFRKFLLQSTTVEAIAGLIEEAEDLV